VTTEELQGILQEKAMKMAEAMLKITAQALNDQVKEKMKDILADNMPLGGLIHAMDEVTDSFNGSAQLKDDLMVIGEHVKVIAPVMASVLVDQVVKGYRDMAKDSKEAEEKKFDALAKDHPPSQQSVQQNKAFEDSHQKDLEKWGKQGVDKQAAELAHKTRESFEKRHDQLGTEQKARDEARKQMEDRIRLEQERRAADARQRAERDARAR
jgi:hypothetical protein